MTIANVNMGGAQRPLTQKICTAADHVACYALCHYLFQQVLPESTLVQVAALGCAHLVLSRRIQHIDLTNSIAKTFSTATTLLRKDLEATDWPELLKSLDELASFGAGCFLLYQSYVANSIALEVLGYISLAAGLRDFISGEKATRQEIKSHAAGLVLVCAILTVLARLNLNDSQDPEFYMSRLTGIRFMRSMLCVLYSIAIKYCPR